MRHMRDFRLLHFSPQAIDSRLPTFQHFISKASAKFFFAALQTPSSPAQIRNMPLATRYPAYLPVPNWPRPTLSPCAPARVLALITGRLKPASAFLSLLWADECYGILVLRKFNVAQPIYLRLIFLKRIFILLLISFERASADKAYSYAF